MRILSITFSNLNSIREVVSLNFAEGPLSEAGIFAITGPTGSGKSTILDAISLALYNETARNQGHEIVSRGQQSASARIEFEVHGDIYRSSWDIRLTKDRATGELKKSTPSMSLDKLRGAGLDGENLTTGLKKKSGVPDTVEQLTGLDFSRFTQSMLLAQGKFDAFLQAGEDDRSELLEQITGTNIYSEVSKLIFAKHSSLTKTLQARKEQLSAQEIPAEEQVVAWRQQLAALEQVLPQQKKQLAGLQIAQRAYEETRELKVKLQQLAKEEEVFAAGEAERQADTQALTEHNKAITLQADVKELDSLKLRIARLESLIEEHQSCVSELSVKEKDLSLVSAAAKTRLAQASNAFAQAQVTVEKVSAVEQVLAKAQKELTEQKQRHASIEESIQGKRTSLAELDREARQLRKSIENLELHLAKSSYLIQVEQQRIPLKSAHQLYLKALQQYEKEEEEVRKSRINLTRLTEELSRLTAQLPSVQALGLQDTTDVNTEKSKVDKEFQSAQMSLVELQRFGVAFNGLVTEREALLVQQARFGKLKEELQQLREQLQRTDKQKEANRKELIELEKSLLLRQQALRAMLELNDLRTSHGHLLVDGKPCPLCGALDHPAGKPIPDHDLKAHRLAVEQEAAERDALALLVQELSDQAQSLSRRLKQANEELTVVDPAAKTLAFKEHKSRLEQEYGTAYQIYLKEPTEAQLKQLRVNYMKLKAQRDTLAHRQNQLTAYVEQQAKVLKARDETQVRLTASQEQFVAREKDASIAKSTLDKAESALKNKVHGLGLSHFQALADGFIEEVSAAITARKHQELELSNALEELKRTQLSEKDLVAFLEHQTKESQEIEKRIKDSAEEVGRLHAKTLSLLDGATSVSSLLTTSENKHAVATREFEEATKTEQLVKDKLAQHRTQRENAQSELAELLKELQSKTVQLDEKAASRGFDTLTGVRTAILLEEEFQRCFRRVKKAEEKAVELSTTRVGIVERLAALSSNLQEEKEETALLQEIQEKQVAVEELQTQRGRLEAQLALAEAAQKRLSQELESIRSAEKKVEHWATLNSLVGSKTGKAFRVFAQSITLQQLIRYANFYLEEFYPRFSVSAGLPGQQKPLDILVCDHYEADQVRPVSTVSGGERFLVSLALALGFSRMASRKISIDTLFIDEGFGALDGETLDKAITALEKLQQRGKTIGIISHVASLQERIATQIRLKRQSSGRSVVKIIA